MKYKPTGNRDTDTAIKNLQSQIDELKKASHPKTTKFNKLELPNINTFKGSSRDFLAIDRFGNVGKRKALSYVVSDVSDAKMLTVNNWVCGRNDIGSTILNTNFEVAEMKENIFIVGGVDCFLKNIYLTYSVNTASKFDFILIKAKFSTYNAANTTNYMYEANTPSSVTSIASSQLYGNATHATSKIYFEKIECNTNIEKGNVLIPIFKYGTGSGTQYLYPKITLEFEE